MAIVLPGTAAPARAGATAQAVAEEDADARLADRFAPVRTAIEQAMRQAAVPSIAVAVVKDGRILWEEGFGFADRERQVRATAHTAYSLASITKPITATAIMKLRDAGKLDIDQPVERYLGGIALTSNAGSSAGVTPRRIMAHSAGLPMYGHFYLDGAKPAGSRETISRYGMTVFPPGTRFEYSNIGMKILDAAIEHVSGRSYADYLRREIFLPLGMRNSAVGLPAGAVSAVRYDAAKAPMRFYLTDHPGSGDVWASAHDMARFLAFHMGTPLAGQRQILQPSTRLEMQRPASAAPMPTPPGAPRRDVGANWIISAVGGHPQIWHSGGQPGSSTYMGFYPDQKVAVVILANAAAPTGEVAKAILDVVAPEVSPRRSDAPPVPPPATALRGGWSGTVTSHAVRRPIALRFDPQGAATVILGDQPGVALTRTAFADGAVSGEFAVTSDVPDGMTLPGNFALKLVPSGGELVGQLIARTGTADVVQMLPSFVRLKPVAE